MGSEISELAKQWIDRAAIGDGVSGTWRLEILQKRIRANADGTPKEGKEVPLRIRRFLKGIPWAQVHDAIRYLISKSPYEDVIYNGLKLDGKYRPTLTQWRRDDQEQVGGNAQGSYTLIQDLIEVTDGKDSASAPSSDSCSETVETEWVWDSPEIEELPYSSEQGVTYAIQQVRRNEDGTFDYAIVKRVARTQVSDETVVQCDEYETVFATVYDNVYGGIAGEPFRDDAGNPVAVPQPCEDREAGVLVQIQKSQNPDCTFRLTVQRTVAKEKVQATETSKTLRGVQTTTVTRNNDERVPETGLGIGDRVRNELQPDGLYTTTETRKSAEDVGDTGAQCERTVFEHQHTKLSNVAERPEDEAPQAGGGKTYEKTVRVTDEGTFDVSERTTTEQYVGSARVVRHKTMRGITVSVTDRNTSNSSTSVTNVGDRVEVEETPGGLYNRTVTTVSGTPVGTIGHECARTVFEHAHTDTSNVAKDPGKEASSAGNGKTFRRTVRMTDEGTYDVSEETTEELDPGVARHSMRKTLRGITETEFHRNTGDSSVSVLNVGDEVVVERTPGGRFNRSVTRISSQSVGDIASGCQTTIFEHQDSVTTNSATGDVGSHAPAAGGGKTYERTVRMTDEGSFDVTERTTLEQGVNDAVVVKRRTLRGVVESVTHRNVEDGSAEVTEIGDEVRVEKTPGGLYNRTETHVGYEAAGEIARGCSDVVAEHTDTNTVNRTEPFVEHVKAGVNEARSVESRRTEEGTYDVTTRDTRFNPVEAEATVENNGSTHPVQSIREWGGRNQTMVPSDVTGDVNKDVSMNASANDHGSMEVSVRETTFREVLSYQSAPVSKVDRWDETVEQRQVVNAVNPQTDVLEQDGEAIREVPAGLNGHGSIDGHWQIRTAKEYFTWEAECSSGYNWVRIVWFRHATKDQYEKLFKDEAKKFKDEKVKKWIDDERHPGHMEVSPNVTPEEYKNRYQGSITMRATWPSESAGLDNPIEETDGYLSYYWNNSVEDKSRTPMKVQQSGGKSEIKYFARKYDSHNWFVSGRGEESFHRKYLEFTSRTNCDTGGIQVSFDRVTKIWSLGVKFSDNHDLVEYNKPR